MRGRNRSLTCALAGVLAWTLTGCGAGEFTPARSLEPSAPQYFVGGIGVVPTAGTPGPDNREGRLSLRFDQRDAGLLFYNGDDERRSVRVRVLVTGACGQPAELELRWNKKSLTVRADEDGARATFVVEIGPVSGVPMRIRISGPGCRRGTDPHPFYARLQIRRLQVT